MDYLSYLNTIQDRYIYALAEAQGNEHLISVLEAAYEMIFQLSDLENLESIDDLRAVVSDAADVIDELAERFERS